MLKRKLIKLGFLRSSVIPTLPLCFGWIFTIVSKKKIPFVFHKILRYYYFLTEKPWQIIGQQFLDIFPFDPKSYFVYKSFRFIILKDS